MISTNLTIEDNRFIERVKLVLIEFLEMWNKKGIDSAVGSFVLSTNDYIYHGVPFEVARTIHGEENAIGAMVTNEGKRAKFTHILITGSPTEIIMPCGKCREAIYKYGVENASILCANKSLSKIEKYSISELYPHPYKDEPS